MGGGDRLVVVDDGDDVYDVVDEGLPVGAVEVIGEVDSDQQLGDGDGGDRGVVIIGDQVIEGRSRAVALDEEGGVEQEPAQGRCSISRSSRVEATSREKAGSRWWRRRSALTSTPLPAWAGSSWATTLPRRTIVKCSPRCSTASSRSEKLRAASVALTSGMRSDYQTQPTRTSAVPTPAQLEGCVDAMTAKLAPTTVRTNLGVLNAVLNAAVDADLIARSPARGIRVSAGPHRERPTLTLEELDRLAAAVPAEYRALILVAGLLGLRWSECVGLRLGDVDFLRRTVTVRQTIAEVEGRLIVAETKSRSSRRTLSVPSFLVGELAQHLAANRPGTNPGDLVFTNPEGGPLRRYFAERVFIPAVERAGLDPALTFHGLRHVAASLMVEQGEHPRVIQGRLGHATARLSMELYAHVPEAADRDVATHLDARWVAFTTGMDRARSGHDTRRTGTADDGRTWSERVEVTSLTRLASLLWCGECAGHGLCIRHCPTAAPTQVWSMWR